MTDAVDAVCQLPSQTGRCRGYIPSYFYNSASGQCEQFIYGGCGGNGNRFKTVEECQARCGGVGGDDCQLAPETGMCLAYIPSYFFNSTSGQCQQFVYGGCGGNGNRFQTVQACQAKCSRETSVDDVCQQPSETGQCRGHFRRYFYNSASGQCQQFTYGGCGGNGNRFNSVEECQAKCSSAVSRGGSANKDLCQQPSETGQCRGYFPSYFYNSASGQCEQFIYGGCGGNDNRFKTREECQATCSSATSGGATSVDDVCQQPSETGQCRGRFRRYFYNSASGQCQQFTYGGCGGNGNRFNSVEECQAKCSRSDKTAVQDVCQLPSQTGRCRGYIPSYFYNSASGQCEQFIYGGCGGNGNRFKTVEECQSRCSRNDDNGNVCQLSAESGNCYAYIPSYFFNSTSGQCEQFIYGGCGGNGNRFNTREQCQAKCSSGGVEPEPHALDVCQLPSQTGRCRGYIPSYFYNSASGQCEQFIYGGCGGNGNRFNSVEECQAKCSRSDNNGNVCQQPAVSGNCYAYIPSYFYNSTSGQCEQFIYGGCGGNGNRFNTREQCQTKCSSGNNNGNVCQLPAESGNCYAYFPSYFYNSTSGQCEQFIYGGCGGNGNRFRNQQECQSRCQA